MLLVPPPAISPMPGSSSSNKPGVMQWLGALPLVTLGTLVLLWSLHVFRLVSGFLPVSSYSLCYPMQFPAQAHRLLTGALLHVDGLHCALNTLALSSVGPKLESSMGSVHFFQLSLVATLASAFLFVTLVFLSNRFFFLQAADGDKEMGSSMQTVGYSACLFALFVIEAEMMSAQQQPPIVLFNRVSLSRRLIPWCMLVLIQVFIPNASFLGHLSGALVGFALCRGLGRKMFFCKYNALDSRLGARVASFRNAPANISAVWEVAEQNPLLCCSSDVGPVLPITASPNALAPAPHFPAGGGHRLGST